MESPRVVSTKKDCKKENPEKAEKGQKLIGIWGRPEGEKGEERKKANH